MKTYTVTIESLQPVIFSRMLEETKEQREKHDEFDKRIWKEKAHYTEDGHVKIPAVMFKRSLESAAKYLKEKIPGQKMSTYSKPFLSAVQIVDDIVLDETRDTLQCVSIPCHADGRRGSGTRVTRRFPIVPKWEGELTIYVGDDAITLDVLMRHIKAAGQFIGVASFRAENGNQQGRFRVKTDAKGKPLVEEKEFAI